MRFEHTDNITEMSVECVDSIKTIVYDVNTISVLSALDPTSILSSSSLHQSL